MDLAMIGLGRMGGNMTKRLLGGGHRVVGYAQSHESIHLAAEEGADPAHSTEEVVEKLAPPRVVWLMVPAGPPTESNVAAMQALLEAGDTVIDGGNSNYKDSQRRATELEKAGIHLVDVGVSGGVWGLTEGYGMMIGGSKEGVEPLKPIFETLAPAPDRGWGHVGPSGAGHFVKMIHNGIEYGLMQAYAEGFAILRAKEDYQLDLHQIASIWRFGTVIRSWLLDLTERALADDPTLETLSAWVDDSGEGRWTLQEAIDLAVPAPVISEALYARFRSRRPDNYADRLLASMRNQFGGHAVKRDN